MNKQVNKVKFQVSRFGKCKIIKACMRIYFDMLLRF
jgi:hypothetical protein